MHIFSDPVALMLMGLGCLGLGLALGWAARAWHFDRADYDMGYEDGRADERMGEWQVSPEDAARGDGVYETREQALRKAQGMVNMRPYSLSPEAAARRVS